LYHATTGEGPNQFLLCEYFDYSSYLNHSFVLLSSTQNAAEQPSLVIVYFGGNDSIHPHPSGLGPHVPLEEYIENMRKIIIHLKVEFYISTL
jgi:lysophospholipase L1-like esterase